METDAEYRAYETIVKNDKRQRVATFLLLLAVLATVVASLAVVASSQKDLIASAQKDGRTRTEENRRYITCLLILQIENRNAAGQRYCFNQSDLPGGRQAAEFNPVVVNADDIGAVEDPVAVPGQSSPEGVRVVSSFLNTAPLDGSLQSNTSQGPALQPATNQPGQASPGTGQQLQPADPSLLQQLQGTVEGIPLIGRLLP